MPLHESDLAPALGLWPGLAGAKLTLINHSENETFLVARPEGKKSTLRVHRPSYQSTANIQSELAWLDALRKDTDVPVPRAIPGIDGQALQHFVTPGGELRHAVLFEFLEGSEPALDGDVKWLFNVLGGYAARLHRQVETWHKPSGFERQAWSAATILDVDGLWGDWRIAPGVTRQVRLVLDRLDAALWRRLAEYGQGADRYGLIHADMRLGNLLVDGERVSLIDFDDSGFCWFAYDFAAAVSFHETHKSMPGLRASWLDGYRKVRPFSAEDEAAIDSMVMLRRMALLAWIGSHAETQLAQTHMEGFAEGTAMLAEQYLRGSLWR